MIRPKTRNIVVTKSKYGSAARFAAQVVVEKPSRNVAANGSTK